MCVGGTMESNEAFIKFKEFQENFKNIKYENSIVGILDILGFKNEIENEDESSLRNLNQVILEKKFLNEELADFNNINFFMLSDTLSCSQMMRALSLQKK